MTNQELFEQAVAGNWVAEQFSARSALGGVGKFCLTGSGVGYSKFSDSIDSGQVVFYAAFDDDCNREAGYGIFNADEMSITPVETTATLRNGRYIDGDVAPIPFPNGGTITCTFNAVAFNSIWSHIWDKNNPHEVNASQVDQDNEIIPGDNVQSALDFLVKALGSEGINLTHIDGNYTYIEIKHGSSRGFPGVYGWDEHLGSWDGSTEDNWYSSYWDERESSWDDSAGVSWLSADALSDVRLAELKLNHDTGDLWTRLIDGSVVKIGSKGSSEPDGPGGEEGELPGGGFIDAPNDGKLYGRQSEDWAEIPTGEDGPNITYTLPVVLRSGAVQLPLTLDGAKLAVMTRGGELELPLAA